MTMIMMTIIKTPPSPLCSFLYALSSLLEAHKGIFMGSTKGKDDSAQRPLKKNLYLRRNIAALQNPVAI